MSEQVPAEVVSDRYQRLVEVADEVAWSEGRRQIGREVEVLAVGAEGKKDASTHRLSGRARDNRLVHFRASGPVRPGDLVRTTVTYAAPHHLIADTEPTEVIGTAGGEAWDRSQGAAQDGSDIVQLGIPTVPVVANDSGESRSGR